MSLFDEDPKRWLELLYSLPPIDLEECFRKQQQAKKKLLDERDKTHLQRYCELKESGGVCNSMAEHELSMWFKTAAPLPRGYDFE